jgi:7-keto-8-aminopelargonate synthetase-like enzyme
MKLILALTVVAVASGCSSLPMQKAENVSPVVACDYARMQTIDRAAQARGVYVEWVHCPTVNRERT